MIVETRHLELISAIRRETTLTRAASALHMTQPAASQALKTLEHRLGVELFVRTPKGMVPTAAGKRVLQTADRALAEIALLERELGEIAGGERRVVRITTECYTCYHWIPRILASFAAGFPGVELEIVPEATTRPVDALVAEDVDLAILHTFPERGDVLACELFRDELVAVFGPTHRWVGRTSIEAVDFESEHLALHHGYADSVISTRLLGPAGVRPRRISELHLTEAVLEVAKSGLGVAVMATWAVQSDLDRGLLSAASLGPEGLYRSWYVATLSRKAADPVLAALVGELQAGALSVG